MKVLRVTMPDGQKWDVPVEVIARNRAAHYASEFGDEVERSLKEDTLLLFDGEGGAYEIEDWAANNMNWDEVEEHATLAMAQDAVDFQEGWVNGEKEILEVPE